MPTTITALPDTAEPATGTPVRDGGAWAQIADRITDVPDWAWATAAGILIAATLVAFPILRTQARKAGARTAGTRTPNDRRDRRLLIGALIPATLFWAAVLIGSGRGLVAFGRDDLNWTGGWEYLIPLTLDGVAISFGLLAFRAVSKERNPDRATRIAWGAMAISAALNFFHEVGGSSLGAIYLAFLSLLGMLIFHEFLAQFEEGAAWIQRQNPKFGLRWFTWPTNTTCAWFAWRNYPPADGVNATIAVAIKHLDDVRQIKAARRALQIDSPAWRMRLAPWAQLSAFRTALTEQRSALESERSDWARERDDLEQRIAARDAETERMAERFRAEAEQIRAEATERIARLEAEHAAQVSRIREKSTTAPPTAPGATRANAAPASGPAEARLSNDEAVELMLRTNPDPNYPWGTREVARLTGAGMGRVPKLIAAVREHHDRSAGTGARNTDDDSKENAS